MALQLGLCSTNLTKPNQQLAGVDYENRYKHTGPFIS